MRAPRHDVVKHRERGLRQIVGFIADLCAEHGLRHNLQRDVHHFLGHINWLAALRKAIPTRQHRLKGIGHDLRETGHVLAMEGRLRQPPLLEPEIAVAGQQPLTGDAAE